jgi:hypothetical protein
VLREFSCGVSFVSIEGDEWLMLMGGFWTVGLMQLCSHIKTRLPVRSVRLRVRKVGAFTHTPSVLGASQVFTVTAALTEQNKASEKGCADHGEEKVCLL